MKRKIVVSLLVIVLTLVLATVVGAAGIIPDDCLDSAVVDNNTICFMGYDDNGNGTTTWTYGVQRTALEPGNGISHIVLSICVDGGTVVPGNGDTYFTPANYNAFVGRPGIEYDVVVGYDPTTAVTGLKYNRVGLVMNVGEVDIFQFTQATQVNPGPVPSTIGFKTGVGGSVGSQITLLGPDCSTTAVELASFQAQSMSLLGRLLQWLGLR